MIRTVHAMLKIAIDDLGLEEYGEVWPVVWCWDGNDLIRASAEDETEHLRYEQWSLVDCAALCDPDAANEAGVIWAKMTLADRPIPQILLYLLHELAHANGIEDETECDEWAFRGVQCLIAMESFECLGVRLFINERWRSSPMVYDRVDSAPRRLPVYNALCQIKRTY